MCEICNKKKQGTWLRRMKGGVEEGSGRCKKRGSSGLWIAMLFLAFLCGLPLPASAREMVIALDPGHGGGEQGAVCYGIQEKDVDLLMAKLVKVELEQYDGVRVVLTREKDERVGLEERARRACVAGADLLVSLHFNASVSGRSKGASVYISTAEETLPGLRVLADHLLGQFEALGLENAGAFARVTQLGGRRADGSFDDYYGVLRHSHNYGMPAVLVEHCFMDNEEDCVWLGSTKRLECLARADAAGIASCYGFARKDGRRVRALHARVFGATSRGVEMQYFKAPRLSGIRLLSYDGGTPGIAEYEVDVEDRVGIHSLWLVYRGSQGKTMTVSFSLQEPLVTGTHRVSVYVPAGVALDQYTLCFAGAYNTAGYDVAYNRSGDTFVGFGKCEWQNVFPYDGEADLAVEREAGIPEEYASMQQEKLRQELRKAWEKRSLRYRSFTPGKSR